MRTNVVIIGHSYSSRLNIIRSVAQIGCEVTVILMTGYRSDGKTLNTKKTIDCYSKYVNRVYYNLGNDGDGLVDLLLTKCIKDSQKPVIISVSDFVTTVIDTHLELLKDHFLFSNIHHRQGAIVEWMNKEKQKALALKVGLNVTKSCSIEVKNGEFTIPPYIDYPCFTKARAYLPGCKSTLTRCDNDKELEVFLKELARKFDLTLLVEEYKVIETEYAIVGFSDGTQVVIPGIIKILSMAHGNHFGVANRGEVLPVNGFEELVEKFKRFILEVGYVGLFDIDFYYSEGKYYFGELNLRMGGSGNAITKMGVNLPAMFVKSMVGECISDMPHTIHRSANFVNERFWIADWRINYIPTNLFYKHLKNSDIYFIKDPKDKGPYRALRRTIWTIHVKKIIKRLVRGSK